MDNLTKRSNTSDMVWFIDHDNNDMTLEPCEMNNSHIRLVLQRLSDYERSTDLVAINNRDFQQEDFTEDEFKLLKLAFKLIDDVVESQRTDNSDVYMCNMLFHLKEKLGIFDIVE